jgi:hypothetical protein
MLGNRDSIVGSSNTVFAWYAYRLCDRFNTIMVKLSRQYRIRVRLKIVYATYRENGHIGQ